MSLSGVFKRGQLASKQRESNGRKRWGGNKPRTLFRAFIWVAVLRFGLLAGKLLEVKVKSEQYEAESITRKERKTNVKEKMNTC